MQLHRWGLLAGWLVGMVFGTWVAASQDFAPVWELPVLGVTAYTALVALLANLVVAAIVTLVLGGSGRDDELEETREPAPTAGAGVA